MYFLAHVNLFKNRRMSFESNTKEKVLELIKTATTPEKLKDDFVISVQLYKVEFIEQISLDEEPSNTEEYNEYGN